MWSESASPFVVAIGLFMAYIFQYTIRFCDPQFIICNIFNCSKLKKILLADTLNVNWMDYVNGISKSIGNEENDQVLVCYQIVTPFLFILTSASIFFACKVNNVACQQNKSAQTMKSRQTMHQKPHCAQSENQELIMRIKMLLRENYKLKQEIEHLSYQASRDSLTDLHNRSHFEGRLSRALRDIPEGRKIAVLFIDCNRFKQINDAHGHASGDILLKTVAGRIRGQLRREDIVARWGGDEFAVLLTSIRLKSDAKRIADSIMDSMRIPIVLSNGQKVICSVSVGIAFYPEQGRTVEDLISEADCDMYNVKKGSC